MARATATARPTATGRARTNAFLGEFPICFYRVNAKTRNLEVLLLFKSFLRIRLLVATFKVFIYNPNADWLALEFCKNCPGFPNS
jgi:hypothetical protein